MNLRLTYKYWMLGALALATASGSQALTMGRARGAALLGQALEITVAVQTAPDETVALECFDAEVYYGDSRQDGSRVKVSASEALPGQSINVKISALAAVDEPIVTVYLRGGCAQKTTRKYVLLADMASEPLAEQAPVLPLVRVPTPPPEAKVPLVLTAPAASTATTTASVSAVSPSDTGKPTASGRKARSHGSSERSLRASDHLGDHTPVASVVRRPRLKLSALDLPERDPVLQMSNELLSTPVEDLQKRADALSIWHSLNATVEDVLAEQARNRAIDADVKALREQSARTQGLITQLGERLERAESQRYANPLVYGLVLLLLLLVCGLVWAWIKMREANVSPYPWWSASGVTPHEDSSLQVPLQESRSGSPTRGEAQATQQIPPEKTVAFARAPEKSLPADAVDIEIDLGMGPSAFLPMAHDIAPAKPGGAKMLRTDRPKPEPVRDFAHSVAGTLRAINSQELLDVRQQADFFMTLGQYDDAISLLEADIRDSHDSNPLVYLDLLKILHTLSRKPEFDHYRREFNLLFTGEVPDYVTFNQSGNRLEQYPDVCRAITQAWNNQDVLEVIEKYLVQSPMGNSPWHFDLEAYRDLLLLHGVATRNLAASDSAAVPFRTSKLNPDVPPPATAPASVHAAIDGVPLPSIDSAMQSVDLNLDSASQNLIDFEVSGFSSSGTPLVRKP